MNPCIANEKLLNLFHSNLYIEALKKYSENGEKNSNDDEDYGLGVYLNRIKTNFIQQIFVS